MQREKDNLKTLADRLMASGKSSFSTLADLSANDFAATQAHSHDFHHLVICFSGKGVYCESEKKYVINAPAVILTSAGVIHFWEDWGDMRGCALAFNSELITLFCEQEVCLKLFHGDVPRVVPLSDYALEEIAPFLKKIKQEWESNGCVRAGVFGSCLNLLLTEIADSALTQKKTEPKCLSVRFKKILDSYWSVSHSPDFYAKKLGVKTDFLSKYLRTRFGQNTSSYIKKRLLKEAKSALLSSNKTIKELSFELGFDDPGYFSRFFRKMTGETPKSYRNTYIKDQP